VTTTVDREPNPPAPSAEEERLRRELLRSRYRRWFWRIAGYVVVLSFWEYASGALLSERLFPGPSQIVTTFGEIWDSGKLFSSFAATLTRIGIGFSIAMVVGAFIGLLTQRRWWAGFLRDAILISITAPGLVWALTGLVIWGFAPMGWIFAIFMTCFGVMATNVSEGIKALPKELMDMARAFRAPNGRIQRQVVIPHLAPYIFTALRFGFANAWRVTVLTEVFSSNEGIGFEMRVATQLFQMDVFFTWVLSFFIFALFLEKVVLQYFERRFFRWRPEVATA
jgi:NitT/TauT family transport system permease protein